MKATAEKTKINASSQSKKKKRKTFFTQKGQQDFFTESNNSVRQFFSPQNLQSKSLGGQSKDKYEKETDLIAEKVVKKSERISAEMIQTSCTECNDEETLQKKDKDHFLRKNIQTQPENHSEDTSAAIDKRSNVISTNGRPGLENVLQASKGRGNPLPEKVRNSMEPAFGADFSRVKINTGGQAVQMNEALGAQAFTYGEDIYFNQNKFEPNSHHGKVLLAHELTHTLQQGKNNLQMLQRENLPPGTDQASEEILTWDPEVSIEHYLQEWEDEKEVASSPVSDEGPAAWLGTGARGQRKHLLIYSEYIKLGADQQYKDEIINEYLTEDSPEGAYMQSLKTFIDKISNEEISTLTYLNSHLKLNATAENFIDIEPLRSLDSANAFPDFAWEIVKKIITPLPGLEAQVIQDYMASKKYYDGYWPLLAQDIFAGGLPVSYLKSLSLTYYRLIKSTLVEDLFRLPNREFMLEKFLMPGETALHSSVMQHCITSFNYHVISSVNYNVLNKWKEPSTFKWLNYNTRAISDFRKEYPAGFGDLDQFYTFEYKGATYSLAEIALAIILNLIGVGGQSPYKILGFKSLEARDLAPKVLNKIVQQANKEFDTSLTSSDERIAQLSPEQRLEKSISWSLEKGFAGESINMLLDKLDVILKDILKEWAKERAIKKGVTVFVGTVGGPLGRLGTLLYNAYETYNDVEDFTEIAGLAHKLASIMEEARSSESVIQSQRSAAKLAEATVTIVPLILQILGSRVLEKLSKGIIPDKTDRMSEAKRNKLLEESSRNNEVKPEEFDAEVLTAIKSPVFQSKNPEYDAIILLPNGHQLRRKNGIWCRSSENCLVPSTNSKFIEDLNRKVDRSIHNAEVFDPDQAIPPGVKPRRVMTTDIGIELGKEFARDTLRLEPLDLPNPLTRSDFSDTGFDDIMTDSQGNWYIMEYKGGEGKLDPGTSTRPPQMSAGWVRHVIQRIRDKGPEWNFIADPIQAKLDSGQLFGYAISTQLDAAGVPISTEIIPGYNKIQF